jgi:para-aminobenzoate synthetase component I
MNEVQGLALDICAHGPARQTHAALDAIDRMNYFGSRKVPFLFIIDFLFEKPIVVPLSDAGRSGIFFDIRGTRNISSERQARTEELGLRKIPVPYSEYERAFERVVSHERSGNSYLTNLTFATEIVTTLTLKDIFEASVAPYRLLVRDEFVVFSPEHFIGIEDGTIGTSPMKGTIDASIENAEQTLIDNEKELAEHITVVDLLRNDLNMVSRNVRVESFRFVSEISTHAKKILQTSSLIRGDLDDSYCDTIGTLVSRLLPAGSVTGAPKKKTVEIILEAEPEARGFYTGVFGWSDGERLESAVMIRFIENRNGRIFARSGGGITIYSDPRKEYEEMIDKVYVPIG